MFNSIKLSSIEVNSIVGKCVLLELDIYVLVDVKASKYIYMYNSPNARINT